MANVKVKNKDGEDVVYNGVNEVVLKDENGQDVTFINAIEYDGEIE